MRCSVVLALALFVDCAIPLNYTTRHGLDVETNGLEVPPRGVECLVGTLLDSDLFPKEFTRSVCVGALRRVKVVFWGFDFPCGLVSVAEGCYKRGPSPWIHVYYDGEDLCSSATLHELIHLFMDAHGMGLDYDHMSDIWDRLSELELECDRVCQ